MWNYLTCQSLFRGHPSIATYRSLTSVGTYVPMIQPTSTDFHCGPFLATDVSEVKRPALPLAIFWGVWERQMVAGGMAPQDVC